MKAYIVNSVFLAIFSVTICGAEDMVPKRSIVLSVGPRPFVFRTPVSLMASYRNQGEATWVIANPTESTRVGVRYRTKKEYPQGYQLGRVVHSRSARPDGTITISKLPPTPKQISVDAGKDYGFSVSLERGWTGNIVPGQWEVWLEDENAKLTSNKVKVRLFFTHDSAVICVHEVLNGKSSLYRRAFHGKWLEKLMPGLTFRWWTHETPVSEQQKMEAEVRRKVNLFKSYMADRTNAGEIRAAIKRINREAGLTNRPPVESLIKALSKYEDQTALQKAAWELGNDVLAGNVDLTKRQQGLVDRHVRKLFKTVTGSKAKTKTHSEAKDQIIRLWWLAAPVCIEEADNTRFFERQKLAADSLVLMREANVITSLIKKLEATRDLRKRGCLLQTLKRMTEQPTTSIPGRKCLDEKASQELYQKLVRPVLLKPETTDPTPPEQ